jgi:hypothetical protein
VAQQVNYTLGWYQYAAMGDVKNVSIARRGEELNAAPRMRIGRSR